MTIFVQIAAYRDSELGPTLQDCLAKAKNPNDLRFGIYLQDDLETDYGVDFNDQRIRLIRVPWQQSQGVCWARHQAQSLYDGETFMLQIDSHHRFADGWDQLLVTDLERCDSNRPILSTYPASYDPVTNKCGLMAPNKILISRFNHKGSLKRYPLSFPTNQDLRPTPARFIAAGFLFTPGQFIHDVPYDPELYFAGEEPNLSVRAFTHGYDVFHPQQTILWHEYVRESKPKHWYDHADTCESNKHAHNIISQREAADMQRFHDMINGAYSEYGLGSARTVHDYERYAGLDFKQKVVHQKTRLGIDPYLVSEAQWQTDNQTAINEKQRIKQWFSQINLSPYLDALQHAKFGLLCYYDREGKMVERININADKLNSELFSKTLNSSAPPEHWILTGFTQQNQWQTICKKRILDYRLIA